MQLSPTQSLLTAILQLKNENKQANIVVSLAVARTSIFMHCGMVRELQK